MKMVAASKLRRAQEQAEAAQPYAAKMGEMLARVSSTIEGSAPLPLLTGTGSDQKHLLVIVTGNRGLCGGFNGNLVKEAKAYVQSLLAQGKEVSLLCVGRKGRDLMRREYRSQIEKSFTGVTGKNKVHYADADDITQYILGAFEAGSFDVCTLIYNSFQSVLIQKPTRQQIIPFELPETASNDNENETAKGLESAYEFEPDQETILDTLLPKNIGVQIFRALLDSAAGEQAARMTAMDNATRNAGEMIDDLTLSYNRARQAYITKELIEIISGAEAL
jgi:F-type H+-transporting ATPase subunit gamma